MPPRTYKKAKKAPRKKMYKRKGVTKSVKKYVKAAIHRSIEDKVHVSYGANTGITTAVNGVVSNHAPYQYNLLPILVEGSEDGERTGKQVMPRSNVFRCYINMLPHSSSHNPITSVMVRMWVCKMKNQDRNAATNGQEFFTDFFEAGQTTTGFQGNMLDMLLPVNRSKWIVYQERKFRLGLSEANGNYSSGQIYDGAGFSKQVTFYCGRHWKRAIQYTDSGSDRPTNTNLWLIVQAVCADGRDSSGFQTCEIHYNHKFTFEDA